MMSSQATPARDVKIILVEDDDGDAKAIRRAFSKARIANPLIRFRNGREALSFLKGETDQDPPLQFVVLSDINMPRMSGIELLEALRDDPTLHKTLFFVLTTSDDERDITAAYSNNVAGYILKSQAGDMFIELMTVMNNFWRIVELPIIDVRGEAHG
ncbi:response regulator [Tritonibacter mobilis]|uniref:Two-component system response regulator n=1 Tax=Tritonibacter mobilis F1926 TaxID=1265309 RepID=A0A1B1A935_9RHOB|nr:response regulator [Tritonibacter mobilis]ANP43079.1 two-component system response regulator [Tritonibacter mobilis F1926]KJZ23154.1 chemotaxis protein CheY [Tritonibacter mobilis]MBU3034518.1 response regulator [Tritonibacter mobilis]WHQ84739.1 response regulator [Tritonibacter mobilis]